MKVQYQQDMILYKCMSNLHLSTHICKNMKSKQYHRKDGETDFEMPHFINEAEIYRLMGGPTPLWKTNHYGIKANKNLSCGCYPEQHRICFVPCVPFLLCIMKKNNHTPFLIFGITIQYIILFST